MINTRRSTVFALVATLLTPSVLTAQEENRSEALAGIGTNSLEAEQVLSYANNYHIAYVRHADPRTTRRGMQILQNFVAEKTSLPLDEEVVELDIETDSLIPFKFIYWPIRDGYTPLSGNAQQKVRDFTDAGKVIMFDNQTRELDNLKLLRELLGDVNIGLMEQMDENHPLTGIFYKVSNMPGNTNLSAVDVQSRSSSVSESISSIIIGRRDWARAWARVGTDTKGQETALRAAAHAVLYAYTGNYKADQLTISTSLDKVNE